MQIRLKVVFFQKYNIKIEMISMDASSFIEALKNFVWNLVKLISFFSL